MHIEEKSYSLSNDFHHWGLTLVGEGVPEIDEETRWTPVVVLHQKPCDPKASNGWRFTRYHCEPRDLPRGITSVVWSFGGNHGTSEDEWFQYVIGLELPIHDYKGFYR
jgi:hypothetical protein